MGDNQGAIKLLERHCSANNLRMTSQRRTIAEVIEKADDHPSIEDLHQRVVAIDPRISISTVYRTVRLMEELRVIERHMFRNAPARFERSTGSHHDHLIDLDSGKVIEFRNEKIETLQREIASKLGYDLVGHRLELYGVMNAKKTKG